MATLPAQQRVFGVVGQPGVVERSLSPLMFSAAFAHHGIDARYERFAIEPEDAATWFAHVGESGIAGVNVTMPYKPLAARCADSGSVAVQLSGSANTLQIGPDGAIHAEATDGEAAIDALGLLGRSNEPAALLVGAGGAAAEIAVALAQNGLQRLTLVNRTAQRAQQLFAHLAEQFPNLGLEVLDQLPIQLPAQVLISAVPAWAFEADSARRAVSLATAVIDLAYLPTAGMTPLVDAAHERRIDTVDGRKMLALQGARSFRYWFNTEPQFEVMYGAIA